MLSGALCISLFVMWRLYKNNLAFLRYHVTLDSFFDSVFLFLFSFSMGARLLHVLEHASYFSAHALNTLLFLHFPGFSFLGGVIGGIVGLVLFCRRRRLPFLLLSDLSFVGLSFAFSFSRIGSLLAGDSYGKETDFFLKVTIAGLSGTRHPTQLYEAFFGFGIFAVLYYLYRRGKIENGFLTVYFFIMIGVCRFFVEMLRGDSVYLWGIPVAQILSVCFVLVGVIILVFAKRQLLLHIVNTRIREKKNI